MTYLITGARGMLGRDVTAALRAAGHDVVPLGRDALDITRPSAVRSAFASLRPRTVVNCAAYTAVDAAEHDEPAAHRVNADGPRHLAETCAATGARLVHISTDYVFAGDADAPYAENAPTHPRTAYGRTKLAGEQAVLETLPETGTVLRTAWLYGAHGPNFVATMAGLASGDGPVDVVADQYGQPTWTADVAARIASLPPFPGVLHATCAGGTTWYGLAREVFTLLGADPDRVRPVTTVDIPRPTPRPANSTLAHARWAAVGLPPLRHWREALHAAWPALGLPGRTA
ncbi:dTDP-4-dehydrorhamnose reductase [Streptomyces sp. AV19]|uniref:dTDP-4-dehydrorhamnose reductase n=1 Tax=Streptomyces sp. AV19 TaxID=2793068 RepID=UPI0018FE3BFE|nr:dTDP-4-dehydrorhamnose reductase [Streptomyces sp. AV19]MBH1937192.1 dTDP-4-dehydrorhamnose reductase [Streptomyces sp. AV19]MDG4533465.1 dTDP-4-dehydrorhamnose reductase [Streptomyces sp. AV19]